MIKPRPSNLHDQHIRHKSTRNLTLYLKLSKVYGFMPVDLLTVGVDPETELQVLEGCRYLEYL